MIASPTRISVGDTVRWTNTGVSAHTSTSRDGIWNSRLLGLGEVYEWTFTSVGNFPYFCEFHPIDMGTPVVIVGP